MPNLNFSFVNFWLDVVEVLALIAIVISMAVGKRDDEYKNIVIKNAKDYIAYQREKIDQLMAALIDRKS